MSSLRPDVPGGLRERLIGRTRQAGMVARCILACWAGGSGCTGAIGLQRGGPAQAMTSTTTGEGGSGPATPSVEMTSPTTGGKVKPETVAAVCAPTISAAPMRRLTRIEYNNTVRDLLGLTSQPASVFQKDEVYGGFETNSSSGVSRDAGRQYFDASEAIADAVDLKAVLPCAPAQGNDTCMHDFLVGFGKRALRRPLQPSELDKLTVLFRDKQSRSDFAGATRLVIATLLQVPSFLYRPELAASTATGAPTPAGAYELATRLSYFLWASMPDQALFAAAEQGGLATRAGVEAEARRMMRDDRFLDAARSFHRQWLGLRDFDTVTKNKTLFPEFTSDMSDSMQSETMRFVDHVFREAGGAWSALLGAPYTFADQRLAGLYGVGAGVGAGFTKVDLPPGQRSGVLTQGSFLAVKSLIDQSSPIRRGLFVREQLFCLTTAPPPVGLDITPPKVDQNSSTKQRFDQHRTDPLCASCHSFFDPIGYGFLQYDPIGRFRTMEGKFPVDGKGEIVGTPDADGPFTGVAELATKVQASPTGQACVARNWVRFALGRPETPEEDCLIQAVTAQFAGGKFDLRELIIAVATSDLFRLRNQTN